MAFSERKRRIKRWLQDRPGYGCLQWIRFSLRPIPSRGRKSYVRELTRYPIGKEASLDTYWMDPPFGPGPCASLNVCGDEVLRFDCLGGEKGHFHLNLTQSRCCPRGETARIYFREGTVEDQIGEAVFHWRRNLDYALRLNWKRRIRRWRIDRPKQEELARCLERDLLRLQAASGNPGAVPNGGETASTQPPNHRTKASSPIA